MNSVLRNNSKRNLCCYYSGYGSRNETFACEQSCPIRGKENIEEISWEPNESREEKHRVRKALYSLTVSKDVSLRKLQWIMICPCYIDDRREKLTFFKLNGTSSIVNDAEKVKMATWLSEMAQRGMGIRMVQFLDFVQDVVRKEKRKTWYYAFMRRNAYIISSRIETPLELKRPN
ncbi:hypothetical protein DPMN_046601 [Dreissena polymorpha]|uniref:Uncharacterized protein n=1 Tax=Dreissena polymorpha TaxID=45954 RepID=A0A9D4D8R1_DREPO|nr:hypothetical protein DPMN_046601 [Dreissena polymorpha]